MLPSPYRAPAAPSLAHGRDPAARAWRRLRLCRAGFCAVLGAVPLVAPCLARALVAHDLAYEWETFSRAVFPTGMVAWVVAITTFRFACPHCRRTWISLFAPACEHCGIAVGTRPK